MDDESLVTGLAVVNSQPANALNHMSLRTGASQRIIYLSRINQGEPVVADRCTMHLRD